MYSTPFCRDRIVPSVRQVLVDIVSPPARYSRHRVYITLLCWLKNCVFSSYHCLCATQSSFLFKMSCTATHLHSCTSTEDYYFQVLHYSSLQSCSRELSWNVPILHAHGGLSLTSCVLGMLWRMNIVFLFKTDMSVCVFSETGSKSPTKLCSSPSLPTEALRWVFCLKARQETLFKLGDR